MPAYYTYLISSLPTLELADGLPFSLEEFLLKCEGLIPEEKIVTLRRISSSEGALEISKTARIETLKNWLDFEINLRNELARARAGRKKLGPEEFIRQPDNPQAHIIHTALSAYRNTSILDAEKFLDQERWNFLDFLSFGHYFDFDFLLIYVLKLKILERWVRIQKADKEALFNQAVLKS